MSRRRHASAVHRDPRAAVACRPSATTWITISRPRQAPNAPYWLGPMMRAAMMVKPYVATFITLVATATALPSKERALRMLLGAVTGAS